MTKEEAKELLPVIQAIVTGKTVQFRINEESEWHDVNANEGVCFNYDKNNYRIKPEPKYRPFEDKTECWEEMTKHEPFGWIKNSQVRHLISSVDFSHIYFGNNVCNSFEEAFNNYKFADGTPFGILE